MIRRRRRQDAGGAAASPTGCRKGHLRASLQEPPDLAAFRRRQPAAPRHGGPIFGDADGRPWLSAPWRFLAAVWYGAADRRHGTVPPIGGTVYRRRRIRQLAARFFGGTVYGRAGHEPPPGIPGGGVLRGGYMVRLLKEPRGGRVFFPVGGMVPPIRTHAYSPNICRSRPLRQPDFASLKKKSISVKWI